MADVEGTEDGDGAEAADRAGGWFMVEAVVEKTTGYQESSDEEEDSADTGEDLVDFIDTRYPGDGQEVPLELFVQQNAQDDAAAVHALKRKYIHSPAASSCVSWVDHELSPRLDAISLDRGHERARRRLFDQDSGYGHTQVDIGTSEGQVPGDVQQTVENVEQEVPEEVRGGGDGEPAPTVHLQQTQEGTASIVELLKARNLRATLLSKFKELYGLAFGELVRQFKSDKSTCTDWVVCAFGVYYAVAEALKTLIQPLCHYAHIQTQTSQWGMVQLMLIRFKCGKSRDTVAHCIGTLLNVSEKQMLIEPPKIKSTPCALYWYKTAMGNASETVGETPEWIVRQTVVGHAMQETQFSLSVMVQWAYDHDITDESQLAYEYALLGHEDPNAAAFLASNCQARYIKDAITMCRHYKRAEQARMSMAQWIAHRSLKVPDTGDWKPIVRFLRFQKIEFMTFMGAFKMWLKGIPKRSCIVIHGPSDTGKSLFCMSLVQFLGGAVISYVNASSHFWLSPLADAKVGLLDDATHPCWVYIDTHLRSVVDGNLISMDRKHRNLAQLKCPPLLITTNINPLEDVTLKYLHSRMAVFSFMYKCPLDDNGDPVYKFNNENWKSFFQRSWARLEVNPEEEEEEEEENGNTSRPFRCMPGDANRPL
ncbi:E1 protein [human papillomavirus 81]|uniref:Replication protein E1 n=2 Tax=human papillomavirus 81 TaxID=333771 RepID=Q705E7_9PAPI|nr:E1 [human papillomavirus 81]QEE83918.1 E1 [human papillomavirus 81]WBF83428.1 MAG: E1 protein [human papillomavirus 81]WBM83542.1 E1 protein [human papillomavirus 81]WBM83555.1 E1 protein [human papillomavirus 81]